MAGRGTSMIKPSERILCVDDEPHNLILLEAMLAPRGYDVVTAGNGREALEKIRSGEIDICLLDVMMPDMDGFEVCRQIKTDDTLHSIPVIMITSLTDRENRIQGIEAGAEDFISKPFDGAEVLARIRMLLRVRKTMELTSANMQLRQEMEERKKAEESLQVAFKEIRLLKERLEAENIYLQQEISSKFSYSEIVGQSDALSHVFLRVEQVAPMNATVLLLGETGTGKGVVARAIHSFSSRKERPMITVNCTSLPSNLIESELFGRERGAFTGANERQVGRFELANGGTIFLDEIGEMPLELQCKLLRVIQDGEFERLGSPHTIKTDVRIIASTNRNLQEEVKNRKFREDLFYRLNVFPITIPPLRQRTGDIPLLVQHFVAKFNKKNNRKIETVSKDTLSALQNYHWPGNVRELESVIERAVIISQGSSLQVFERFDTFRTAETPPEENVKVLALLEQDHILQVLQKTGWRIDGKKGAALLLGLNPSTLRSRMLKYGIQRR